ncbi:hypothetical protein DFH09DRAFT_1074447 [Mycena vulgaris]|nr:hypothetical protein DFH09DRAFT_1074447 [Mycena vulgaris]
MAAKIERKTRIKRNRRRRKGSVDWVQKGGERLGEWMVAKEPPLRLQVEAAQGAKNRLAKRLKINARIEVGCWRASYQEERPLRDASKPRRHLPGNGHEDFYISKFQPFHKFAHDALEEWSHAEALNPSKRLRECIRREFNRGSRLQDLLHSESPEPPPRNWAATISGGVGILRNIGCSGRPTRPAHKGKPIGRVGHKMDNQKWLSENCIPESACAVTEESLRGN